MHNYRAPPTIPPSYTRFCAVVWECGEGQTDRHTDGHDQYTSHLGYASREVVQLPLQQQVVKVDTQTLTQGRIAAAGTVQSYSPGCVNVQPIYRKPKNGCHGNVP